MKREKKRKKKKKGKMLYDHDGKTYKSAYC